VIQGSTVPSVKGITILWLRLVVAGVRRLEPVGVRPPPIDHMWSLPELLPQKPASEGTGLRISAQNPATDTGGSEWKRQTAILLLLKTA
jgi:hypothetical protein